MEQSVSTETIKNTSVFWYSLVTYDKLHPFQHRKMVFSGALTQEITSYRFLFCIEDVKEVMFGMSLTFVKLLAFREFLI